MLKDLPLTDLWKERGAKFVEFAGYKMPLKFTSIVKEHMAVREASGLFDVSHMGFLEIKGGEALRECERLFPSSLKKSPGSALYTVLLNEQGGIIDDLMVYILSPQHLFCVVNAARKVRDVQWMQSHLRGTEVIHDTRACILALQGPKAKELISSALDADTQSLFYMHFQYGRIGRFKLFLARTGYTGSDGFEVVIRDDAAKDLAEELLELGAIPCGLGARDSLRLEAGYRLYGQDIDENTTPLQAGLSFVIDWNKDFFGKEALLKEKREGIKQKCEGFVMEDKGIPRHGYEVLARGEAVGIVTSGGYSPLLKKGIGLCYIPAEMKEEYLEIIVHDKPRKARRKRPPFVATNLYRKPQAQ